MEDIVVLIKTRDAEVLTEGIKKFLEISLRQDCSPFINFWLAYADY